MPVWENPLRELVLLQERMNRLLDESLPDRADERGGWMPVADTYETGDVLVISADLPGIERETLRVDVEGNRLYLTGERRPLPGLERIPNGRQERPMGPFSRSFVLPSSLEISEVRAEYKNGVLTIRIPRRNEREANHVSVTIE